MSPLDVSSVDALENNVSYVNRVRLWCRLGSPQCAHKIAFPNQFDTMTAANSITAETIPFVRQRDAIVYLVYLMGGNVEHDEALLLSGGDALDTGTRAASVRALTLETEEIR
jgi:hypothetical protein